MTVLNLAFLVGGIVTFIIILGLISGAIKSPFKRPALNTYSPLETSDSSSLYSETDILSEEFPMMAAPALRGCYLEKVPESEASKSNTADIVYDPESVEVEDLPEVQPVKKTQGPKKPRKKKA